MADTQDEVATISVEVAKPTKRFQQIWIRKFVCNKCCICVPLRTGCLILAYLYLVGSIVSGMCSLSTITNRINIMSRFPQISHDTIMITSMVLNSVNVGLALFAIAINVLLLIGLHKEKQSFVRLFVTFQFAYTILYAVVVIVVIAMSKADTVNAVICLATLVLNIYCTFVMRSQYLKMGASVSAEPVGRYKDGHLVITP